MTVSRTAGGRVVHGGVSRTAREPPGTQSTSSPNTATADPPAAHASRVRAADRPIVDVRLVYVSIETGAATPTPVPMPDEARARFGDLVPGLEE